MTRGRCKVGDTAGDWSQSWSENTLVVPREYSVALEVVLEQWLGGQMAVEEVGWLCHAGGSCQKKKYSPKIYPCTLPDATALAGQFAVWLWCHLRRPSSPKSIETDLHGIFTALPTVVTVPA